MFTVCIFKLGKMGEEGSYAKRKAYWHLDWRRIPDAALTLKSLSMRRQKYIFLLSPSLYSVYILEAVIFVKHSVFWEQK